MADYIKSLKDTVNGFKNLQNINLKSEDLIPQNKKTLAEVVTPSQEQQPTLKDSVIQPTEEIKQPEEEKKLPTPEQAAERKPLLDEEEKLTTEIQKINNKPSYVPNLQPHLDAYLNLAGKEEKANIEPYLQTLQELKQKTDDIIKQKGEQLDRTEKFAMYEKLGEALSLVGAGLYGMKHNVDMSGMKFNPTDWDAKLKNRLSLLDDRLNQYKEEGISAVSDIKSAKQEAKEATKQKQDLAEAGLRTSIKQEEMKAEALNKDDAKKLKGLQDALENLTKNKQFNERMDLEERKLQDQYKKAADKESKAAALADLKQQQRKEQALTQTESLINLYSSGQIKKKDFIGQLTKVTDDLPPDVAALVTSKVEEIEPASTGWFSSTSGKVPVELKNIRTGQPAQTNVELNKPTPSGTVRMIHPNGQKYDVPAKDVEAALQAGYSKE